MILAHEAGFVPVGATKVQGLPDACSIDFYTFHLKVMVVDIVVPGFS